jgi:S1-C subfamily serine protease
MTGRWRLALTLALVRAFLPSGPAFAATPAEIRASNRDALVYLEFKGTDANGVERTAEATGFLVSPDGLVLTARHSVEDAQGRPSFDGDAYTIRGAIGSREEDLRRLELVEKSGADAMLLRFRGDKTDYKPVKVCSGVAVEVGERLATLGFPKAQDLSIIDGLLSSKAAALWQTSVPFTYGYSGGPVFAEDDGQLVGLVQGGIAQAQSVNFFTPIHRATSLLQNGGASVPPCRALPPQPVAGSPAAAPAVNASGGGIAIGGDVSNSEVTVGR